jgi:hypothetical protein
MMGFTVIADERRSSHEGGVFELPTFGGHGFNSIEKRLKVGIV